MLKFISLLLIVTNLLFANIITLESGNILIHYPGTRQELAVFITNTIQAKRSYLESIMGVNSDTVNIYLTDSQTDFRNIAGAHLPDWSGAVTIFPRQIIVLKSPRLTNITLREFRTAVEHEFIHLYQSRFVPLNITPAWFNEGWAQYASNSNNIQGRILLSRALFNEQLIPMTKLTDFLNYNNMQASLAYIESLTIIEFLCIVYGEQIIGDLFADLQTSKNFNESLLKLTSMDKDTLESSWQKYITQRYRWIFLLDIQYIIWLIIPILVIIVYFIKGHRNKNIIQQWNTEENSEIETSQE